MTITKKSISIWSISLKEFDSDLYSWKWLVDDATLSRIKLMRDKLSENHLKSQIILRLILFYYLQIAPHKIEFSKNAYGKPSLKTDYNYPPIHFNISHSGDILILAFSMNASIGIDVEIVRNISELNGVINMACTDFEQETIKNLKRSEQNNHFLKLWTSKEAFIKAIGLGLSFPLKNLEIIFSEKFIPCGVRVFNTEYEEKKTSFFYTEVENKYCFSCVSLGKELLFKEHFNRDLEKVISSIGEHNNLSSNKWA